MKKLNILICGSQKFQDEEFVFHTLTTLFEQVNGNIGTIITSKFSGACKFAENWVDSINEVLAEDDKIKIKHYLFDKHLMQKNQSIYSQVDIPREVLQADQFFIKGKELIMSEDIQIVMAFPNPDSVLGPATYNIQRFASLAGAKVFDCSDLFRQRNEYRKQEATALVEPPMEDDSSPMLNNKLATRTKKSKP